MWAGDQSRKPEREEGDEKLKIKRDRSRNSEKESERVAK